MIIGNDLSSTDNPLATTTQPQSEGSATAAADFQSFLTLLTTQLRNQDPLSPLDSTQFVEQLASFSAVEQQVETNDRLESLASSLTGSGLENAAQWVGNEVEVPTSTVSFSGDPLSFRIPPATEAGSREMVISDQNGNVVFRQAINNGSADFTWDGTSTNGNQLAHGSYQASISTTNEEGDVSLAMPHATARVVEARLEDAEVKLVLENGAVVSPSNVTALRASTSSDSI